MKHNIMTLILSLLVAVAARGSVYICGGFQGWQPATAVEMTALGNDQYSATIDFSTSNVFKISTVRPDATLASNEQWGQFDSGAMDLGGATAAMGIAMPLYKGIANIYAPANEAIAITVDLSAMTLTFGEQTDVKTSGTLPVVYVNTTDYMPVTSKEEYVEATIYIDPKDSDYEALGSADEPLALQIRGRGNYTWSGFDKKPYRLKLGEKAEVLGLSANKNFGLLARADDIYGYLRDAVGFELSRRIGMEWTPGEVPCEFVLNGKYMGLYFMTELVRVGKNRVNVIEQLDNDDTDPTGGWLVEIDNYDTDPHVTINSLDGGQTWFTYKSPEALSEVQETWLLNQMYEIDDRVYADDKSTATWAELIDLRELARYYIVQEVMDDYESFHGSCYLHRQQGETEKWKFGPVWDFGSSFNYDKSCFIYQDRQWRQPWIGEMCRFPDFIDVVKDEWYAFLSDGLGDIDAYIDDYIGRISAANVYDYHTWPQYAAADLSGRASEVKRKVGVAIDWLKGQWGAAPAGLQPVPFAGISVAVSGPATIAITAQQAATVVVYRADGTIYGSYAVGAGTTYVTDVPVGLYIAAGKKLLVK